MDAEALSTSPLEALPAPEPLPNLFLAKSKAYGDRPVTYAKIDGRWSPMSWRESRQVVEESALGLLELGADKGTPIAVLAQTRREWGQLDLAIQCIGGITIGIYPSLTGAQSRQILELSGARIVIVDERAQRQKLEEACADLSPPIQIVMLEATAEGRAITLDELRRRGAKRRQTSPEELSRRIAEIKTSDVVSYIYTSGTTGEPKGAMLTHANFHYVIHATNRLIPYSNERALAFLPLAHSLQRYASYLALITDVEGYFAESLDKVRDNLVEVQPTCFALVPRVLEKIHARALALGQSRGGWRTAVFDRSVEVLRRVGRERRGGFEPGIRNRVYARAADRFVGQKIRDGMGGRVKFIGSGGAPLPRETHEFFEDLGIPILEGYGLTETCAPATINSLEHRRIGTVGRPLPGTDVRIAEDGEIMIRGPGVFGGYHKNDAATKDCFDDEGWFKSGDIGEMSRDGFLTITDRKKDLIITAGGKNVAPQPLESKLKHHPWIGQAVVIGDRRPYLTALIGIDPEAQKDLAARHGVKAEGDPRALAAVPAIRAELERHFAAFNKELPGFEQVKRFDVLPAEMTIESGELTPTLKVKRRVVNERYKSEIDQLYSGG